MLALSFSLAIAFYLCAPFVLGAWVKRRFGGAWWLFAVGALTFLVSQLVHLPLLHILGAIDVPDPGPALRLPVRGAMLGLVAGLCEEWARFATFRLVLPERRRFGHALSVGVGHGGIEAVILGVLLGTSLLSGLAFARAGLEQMGIPADQLPAVQARIDAMFNIPAFLPLIGIAERAVTIAFHIAMTTLVAYAVRSRRLWPVWLAVLAHLLLDGTLVFLDPHHPGVSTVLWYIGVVAATGAILAWMARKDSS